MYRTLWFLKFPAPRRGLVAKSRIIEKQTETFTEFPDLERKKQELYNLSTATCKSCSNVCLKHQTCVISRKRTPLDNRITFENGHLSRAIAYHKNAVSNRNEPS
jgi:hypothetical protein